MEPRTPPRLALLCTLLALAVPPANADTRLPQAVTKCVVDGVTSYSDQPCSDGLAERRIALDKAVIVLVAQGLATPPVRSARCEAAQAELHNIDVLTRQGQPPDMQAFLDARRQHKRNEQLRYRC